MTQGPVADALDDAGFACVGLGKAAESGEDAWPLHVGLETDRLGRDRIVVLTPIPSEPDDPVQLLHLHFNYPFVVRDGDTLAEVVRAIFLLNRTVPLGHNGLVEEEGGLIFTHTLLLPPSGDQSGLIVETVAILDHVTAWQGGILDRVASGQNDMPDVMSELDRRGLRPHPLLPVLPADSVEEQSDVA